MPVLFSSSFLFSSEQIFYSFFVKGYSARDAASMLGVTLARVLTWAGWLGLDPSADLRLSFQDLVAQSVNKLVTILQEVEHKLLQLVVVFGPYQKQAAKQSQDKASEMLKQLEATKNTSMDQDLADEILKQFGFN